MPNPSNSDLVGEARSAWEMFLHMPVDFDPLRDPKWQPDREDYRSFRDAAIARVDELAQQLEQAEQQRDDAVKVLRWGIKHLPWAKDQPTLAASAKLSEFRNRARAALTTPDSATGQEEG